MNAISRTAVRFQLAAVAASLALAPACGPGAKTPTPAQTSEAHASELAARVRAEFAYAWQGYKTYAWGHDELKPLSRTYKDWYSEPLYMTPIDALDTMLIMGMKEDAETTKSFLVEKLSFDKDISVKNFEITIRVLGGLLSAYQMTGDARLLALAEDLGKRLLPVFDSPTGMPYTYVNLRTGKATGAKSNPAEIGTLILEFGTLAKLTKKPAFYEKPKRALVELYNRRAKTGLVGEEIDVETGEWKSPTSHVGGGIDSYYEYLLKCERLFGDPDCGRMWRDSIGAVNRYLADDGPGGLWYGESDMTTGQRTATTYGALHAFLPAVLALDGQMDRARRLQDSGFRMWTSFGIEPEVLDYRTMQAVSPGYVLRPEIVESAYYLHHFTNEPKYIEMGRTFLDALERNCRTDIAFTTLKSVITREKGDLMHSFFFAETLKYLYLLFAPAETLDFDHVVFNTEAHPLRKTW